MTRDNFKGVTCNKCGWVHFAVSAAYVKSWHDEWLEYWPTLDDEGKDAFGLKDGPPTTDSYLHCFLCGGSYRNFRDSREGDSPEGSTIGPILARDEELE